MSEQTIYPLLPVHVRELLFTCRPEFSKLQEIRLRMGQPVLLRYDGREYALCPPGRLSGSAKEGYRIVGEDLREALEYLSGYSLYAFDEEIRQGFLTVQGGHRVGLAGHVVLENGRIRLMRPISFLNIRLSHQIKGCADPVLPYLFENGRLCNTLLLSPPGCGKTTLLRDLIRQISDGSPRRPGFSVGVADERAELAGSYLGVPQNDLGMRTDVLDCCPKAEGMRMLLRSMRPDVIAVDELGGPEDCSAVENACRCGCALVATVHASSAAELSSKPMLRAMMARRIFERYVILSGRPRVGTVTDITDAEGRTVMQLQEESV